MAEADRISHGRNSSEALQASFKDAMVATVNTCTQQNFLAAFPDMEKYHNKLYKGFAVILQDVLLYSLIEFDDIMDDRQIPAHLAQVSALSDSRGIVPRPYSALQAMASQDRLAAKATEKENLKRILEMALQEQEEVSDQLERKKSAAAALRADIAAMGEEYREVQGKDSRWRSRNMLSM